MYADEYDPDDDLDDVHHDDGDDDDGDALPLPNPAPTIHSPLTARGTPRLRAPKAPPEERRRRTSIVVHLIINGHTTSQIADYCVKNFGIGRKYVREEISRARKMIRGHLKTSAYDAAAESVAWWRQRLGDPETDTHLRMAARKELDRILGVNGFKYLGVDPRDRDAVAAAKAGKPLAISDDDGRGDGPTADGSTPSAGEPPSIDDLLSELARLTDGGEDLT